MVIQLLSLRSQQKQDPHIYSILRHRTRELRRCDRYLSDDEVTVFGAVTTAERRRGHSRDVWYSCPC